MLDKIYVVTDLGPGDGGKGSVVHFLSQEVDASIIIKRGGAQGSHGVRTSQGESFNFSQWGCGTLEGVPTYCSPQMIISPVGLENESNALQHHGIYDPFTLLSINPECICSTPYHMIASQLEELTQDTPRGTVGTGVGKAYRMYQSFGRYYTLQASDLKDIRAIRSKITMQMEYYREIYKNIDRDAYIGEDKYLVNQNLNLLHDDGLLDYTVNLFEDVGKKIHLKELSEILNLEGTAIVECSHGVLTDAHAGFRPHVSAIRTLPIFVDTMLRERGYTGEILNLAVHRAYEIRHGAGPMPTYDPEFTKEMLPGSHKEENRWQGAVRAGPLDAYLIRWALDACSDTLFDGLCLTWMDQILKTSRDWRICKEYPLIENHHIPDDLSKNELFNFIKEIVIDYVDVPLKLLSIGPTEKDKIMRRT